MFGEFQCWSVNTNHIIMYTNVSTKPRTPSYPSDCEFVLKLLVTRRKDIWTAWKYLTRTQSFEFQQPWLGNLGQMGTQRNTLSYPCISCMKIEFKARFRPNQNWCPHWCKTKKGRNLSHLTTIFFRIRLLLFHSLDCFGLFLFLLVTRWHCSESRITEMLKEHHVAT